MKNTRLWVLAFVTVAAHAHCAPRCRQTGQWGHTKEEKHHSMITGSIRADVEIEKNAQKEVEQ